jgi:type IV pilus assembly protein PilW
MRSSSRSRGFTLVELLVVVALIGFVMALVMGTFMSQQRSIESTEVNRGAQDAQRDAMLELDKGLRRAGFGINPRYALDLRTYRCGATNGTCRDRTDAPDELVFVSRNAQYQTSANGCLSTPSSSCVGNVWSIAGLTGTTLTLRARGGERFRKGRVLLLACAGAQTTTMVTVNSLASAGSAGDLSVTLTADPNADSANPTDPYQQTALAAAACFTAEGAAAFLVDRFRYFIRAYNGTPYLMLDAGIDLDEDGLLPAGDDDDLLPIAPNIEDLQVSYVFPSSAGFTPADGTGGDAILGNTAGTQQEPDPTLAAGVDWYRVSPTSSNHYIAHPANVRAIRIDLNVRSSRTDPGPGGNWTGDPLFLNGNRNTQLGSFGRFRRSLATSTVTLRNVESRSPFIF